jgi:hypothetical protein
MKFIRNLRIYFAHLILIKLIKQPKGGYRTRVRVVKDKSGKLLLEDMLISERWAEYIEEL